MANMYGQGMGQMMPNMAQQPNGYGYPFQSTTDMYRQRLADMTQQLTPSQNGYNSQFQPNNLQGNVNVYNGQNTANQGYSVRAVTGYEEVLASQIPLDGSVSFYTDFSHGNIYTKQLNMSDGTALIKTYKLGENPKSSVSDVENSVEYVKKAEFDDLKKRFDDLMQALTTEPAQKETPKSNKKEGK